MKTQMFYELSADVKAICKPLFEAYGLTYFNYSRIHSNKISILTTFPEWREHFIKNGYQNISILDTKKNREKIGEYRIWDAHAGIYPTSNNLRIQKDANTRFKLYHGLTICRDNVNFSERFTFATTQDNYMINEHYEQSRELFKKFTLYFKDKAHTLIKLSDAHTIAYPLLQNEEKSIAKIDFFEKIKIKKMYIETPNNTCYLTYRELHCIQWALYGKTIEETAMILNLSPSTVKTHIFNVKQKLGVVKMIDIFRILKEQGIDIYHLEDINHV